MLRKQITSVLGAMTLALSSAAFAVTFNVTKTADTNDGTCDADCSLREAIVAANAAGPGPHTINVPAGTYALTIAGANENAAASGDLDILVEVNINGAGAATTIVDGGALDRVFDIRPGVLNVAMSAMTVRNGLITGATGTLGGGINAAGGTLTLAAMNVTGNRSEAGGGIAGGTVDLTGTTVSNNIVQANNSGGGIRASTVNALQSTISGNSAGGQGGGIFANNLTLIASTVSGNASTNSSGGGIHISNGTVTITNSTISGNSASSGVGGGFRYLPPPSPPFPAVGIESSTIVSNTAGSSGGGIQIGQSGGILSIRNTIVAGNTATTSPECDDVNSLGNNLIQNPAGCTITGTTAGNITGVSAQVGPLANNGGPTDTHGLLVGSPAIDAANPVGAPTQDQRGVARPVGAGFDIGSFEGSIGGALPTLSINSVSASEGNGVTTTFTFTVTLSAASASNVTVDFATADGTASSGSDYTTAAGTLTFAPGQTTQAIAVSVLGDNVVEANETFLVNLSNPSGATIATAQGTGTIINDDAGTQPPPQPPASAEIPTLSEWVLMLLMALLAGAAYPRLRRR